MSRPEVCTHLKAITEVRIGEEHVCEECIKHNGHWVHLRTCQTCGSTLCCDSSPNKHMSKHAQHSYHPVAASAEPGERWLWCYSDEQMAEY